MKLRVLSAALLSLAVTAPMAHAVGTAAGTDIVNQASATYDDPDNPGSKKTEKSNKNTLTVDELLNVTVVSNDSGSITVSPGDTGQVQSYTVTNTGNGPEQYVLSLNNALSGNDFNPTNVKVYFDTNGNGFYDAGDTLYVPSGVLHVAGNEPTLQPDESVVIFVVSDIPGTAVNGDQGGVSVTAEALTAQETAGIDSAGHVFVGSGTSGSDAIVGTTQAVAASNNVYIVTNIQTTFTKTSSVSTPGHPEYGSNPVPGSIITYTLTFVATGSGSLTNMVITDNIPTNTTFVNNSLKLNGGAAFTDVTDGDAGSLETGVDSLGNPIRFIQVSIPTITAPETNVVTFQVTIN